MEVPKQTDKYHGEQNTTADLEGKVRSLILSSHGGSASKLVSKNTQNIEQKRGAGRANRGNEKTRGSSGSSARHLPVINSSAHTGQIDKGYTPYIWERNQIAISPAAGGGQRAQNRGGRYNASQTRAKIWNGPKEGQSNPLNLSNSSRQSNRGARYRRGPSNAFTPRVRQGYAARDKLFQAQQTPQAYNPQEQSRQLRYLHKLIQEETPKLTMSNQEYAEKIAFRDRLLQICEDTVKMSNGRLSSVNLAYFGSFSSGLATAGSDVDLAVVSKLTPTLSLPPEQISLMKDALPRLLEQALLQNDIGARLLTKTRVPIIKVCEKPSAQLLQALKAARQKWDDEPDDVAEEASNPKPTRFKVTKKEEALNGPKFTEQDFPSLGNSNEASKPTQNNAKAPNDSPKVDLKIQPESDKPKPQERRSVQPTDNDEINQSLQENSRMLPRSGENIEATNEKKESGQEEKAEEDETHQGEKKKKKKKKKAGHRKPRPRERRSNPLDFPHSGVGTLCDINFSNPLALQNTALLRCYTHCDPRVKPMVCFVKGWVKQRKINSAYNGTLSSYGYVLMILHFLINIAYPPVLPNLQLWATNKNSDEEDIYIERYKVSFWRDEDQIKAFAAQGQLVSNHEPLEALLLQFFHYYAAMGANVFKHSFNWMQNALSLRTPGGIRTKQSKGWIAAKTMTNKDRVRTVGFQSCYYF